MNAEELWTRREALSPAEERELLDVLQRDPALRERLLDDLEMDGLLSARDEEAFAAAFFDRLRMEDEGSRFIARVERRIRRVRRRPASGGSWLPALVAAGVLAVLGLIAAAAPSRSAPTPPPRPVVERRAPARSAPEPEAPRPVPLPPPPPKIVVPVPKDVEAPPGRKVPDSSLPLPAPRPEPPPPPAPVPAAPTRTAIAVLQKAQGTVEVDGAAAAAGLALTEGQGLSTGADGAAAVAWTDGTRAELGASTAVRGLGEAPKRLLLDRGWLAAEVVRQAQPMVVRTPQGEACVLGTSFVISIEDGLTRLAVKTGKVRLTRLSDGRWVDVAAGQTALAGPGTEFFPKAPKLRVLFAESFDDPRGVDARWRAAGTLLKTPGRLEADLSPRAPEGWSGGGVLSKVALPAPLALEVDVDVPLPHAGVVAAVVFVPQGKRRGAEGVFRVQLRDARYAVFAEAGEPRELAGVDRPGGGPCRERWRLELQGGAVRLLVQDREVLKHALDIAPSLHVGLDGSARGDAPAGARAAFDNLSVEPLR